MIARTGRVSRPMAFALAAGLALLILTATGGVADEASALHDAVATGDLAEVRARLAAGDDVHETGILGLTALHFAARAGRVEIATALLDAGAIRMPAVTPASRPSTRRHTATILRSQRCCSIGGRT